MNRLGACLIRLDQVQLPTDLSLLGCLIILSRYSFLDEYLFSCGGEERFRTVR